MTHKININPESVRDCRTRLKSRLSKAWNVFLGFNFMLFPKDLTQIETEFMFSTIPVVFPMSSLCVLLPNQCFPPKTSSSNPWYESMREFQWAKIHRLPLINSCHGDPEYLGFISMGFLWSEWTNSGLDKSNSKNGCEETGNLTFNRQPGCGSSQSAWQNSEFVQPPLWKRPQDNYVHWLNRTIDLTQ